MESGSLLGPVVAVYEGRDVQELEHTSEIVGPQTGILTAWEGVAGGLEPLKCGQAQAWGLLDLGQMPDGQVDLPSSLDPDKEVKSCHRITPGI